MISEAILFCPWNRGTTSVKPFEVAKGIIAYSCKFAIPGHFSGKFST